MKMGYQNRSHSITFHQWSRKSYALFSTLGKAVKIAVLKTEIAETKAAQTISPLYFNNHLVALLGKTEEDELLESNPLLTSLSIAITDTTLEAAPASHINHTIYKPLFWIIPAGVFIFTKLNYYVFH